MCIQSIMKLYKIDKGPSIIVNVKLGVQNILFFLGGGGNGGKNVDSVHFQHISPFYIIFLTNYPFEKC